MKKPYIEEKLKKAFASAVPDNFGAVLSGCENKKGKALIMTKKNKNQTKIKNSHQSRIRFIAAAASFAIIIAAAAGFSMLSRGGIAPVTALVSLDVNPSLEMKINCKTDRIIELNALNGDAKTVIGDMDFKGTKLDAAVNALIGSMLKYGYLSDAANSVLISVESKNAAEEIRLKDELTGKIAEILNKNISGSAILAQSVNPENKELKTLGENYGITPGKAQLVSTIIEGNPLYTFESLASCTVNELNILLAAGNIPHEEIDAVGNASTEAYIDEAAALAEALADAGISANEASDTEIEFDFNRGRMIYEIEFRTADFEYEYEIDAATGEILEFERESIIKKPENNEDFPKPSEEYIGREKAIEIALARAGVSRDEASGIDIEQKKKHGKMIYEVEFLARDFEYEYGIDAATGEVLEFERETSAGEIQVSERETSEENEEDWNEGGEPPEYAPEPSAEYIGAEKALKIALAHAGVSRDEAGSIDIEQKKNHGRMIYEAEFLTRDFEYEYEIDAASGEILEFEREPIVKEP